MDANFLTDPTRLPDPPPSGSNPAIGSPAESPPPEAIDDAFAVFGLTAAADIELVELAYWRHVDMSRSSQLSAPAWQARLTEINHARLMLSRVARRPGVILPPSEPRAGQRGRRFKLMIPVLAILTLAPVSYLVRLPNWDLWTVAAGAFIALAALTFGGLAVTAVIESGAPPPQPREPDPYDLLCVLPEADQELIVIAYRHLLRVALLMNDEEALDVLERCYARLGTPAARAAYDLRAAQVAATPLPAGDQAPAAASTPPAARPKHSRRGGADPRQPVIERKRRWSFPRLRLSIRRPARAAAPARPVARWTEEHDPPEGATPVVSRAAAGTAGTLRVLQGKREVLTLVLREGGMYTIGAGAHCDVRLPAAPDAVDSPVAAEHARLTTRRGRVLFHHLASSAVSLINGERAVWAVLESGDTLGIGPYSCQFAAPSEARPEPPATVPPVGDSE